MQLFKPSERTLAQTFSDLLFCNPFLPKRVELERKAIGSKFIEAPGTYYERLDWEFGHDHPNAKAMVQRVERPTTRLHKQLSKRAEADVSDLILYEHLALYRLYRRHLPEMDQIVAASGEKTAAATLASSWDRFLQEFNELLALPGRTLPISFRPGDVFAGFFQIRRAFYHIYHSIFGTSARAVQLQCDVWYSIFTDNMQRFFQAPSTSMADISTLITGPSGTGKELIAQTIAKSRFIPFDPGSKQFASDFTASFHPVNLSAIPPTPIESELFGHAKGAFTGAVKTCKGRLEECDESDTVFFDEIGELDAATQVRLLRVLQERPSLRLGGAKSRSFKGKIVSATNRNLDAEVQAGRLRSDLCYRLCADKIETPSLRDQLDDAPDDLHDLICYVIRQQTELEEAEAATLAEKVEAWIDTCPQLGRDYPWPGNIREFEQCVRNVMIRGEYEPHRVLLDYASDDPRAALAAASSGGELTVDQLVRQYCTLIYARDGDYKQTGKALGVDRRTVKKNVDEDLLPAARRYWKLRDL